MSSQPDHSPQTAEKEAPQKAGTLTVGAVNDHAERDADQRADAALSWLAGLQPGDRAAAPEPHVHTAACSIGRSPAGTAESGVIGAAGGALDSDTSDQIRRMKGGGERLSGDVRTTMEAAFGTDLGRVRVHRGGQADRLSRSISAEAFTTGNDIFFSEGAYDPSSARGQRVLAHELGHVLQGGDQVGRFWKKKTEEEKQAEKLKKEQKAQQKKEEEDRKAEEKKKEKARQEEETRRREERTKVIKQNKTSAKETDKEVRSKSQKVNKNKKALDKKIKTKYELRPESQKNQPLFDLTTLTKRFQDVLIQETMIYERIKAQHEKTGKPVDLDQVRRETDAEIESVWESAGDDVRALRPNRYDEFDKALNEVREFRQEHLKDQTDAYNAYMENHEQSLGSHITPDKAMAKVYKERALARQRVRAEDSRGRDNMSIIKNAKPNEFPELREDLETKLSRQTQEKYQKKVEEAVKQGKELSLNERAVLLKKCADDVNYEKYGDDELLLEQITNVRYAEMAHSITGSLGKGIGKAIPHISNVDKNDTGLTISDMTTSSLAVVGSLLDLAQAIMTFIASVREINRGTADPGAKLKALREFVDIFQIAASATRSAMKISETGVKAFESGNQQVINQLGLGIPIVSVVTSSLGVISSTLDLVPLVERHTSTSMAGEQAIYENKQPLAAGYARLTSRNLQLMEKEIAAVVKNCTNLGFSIVEVCTAGGLGFPATAKLIVTVVDVLHKIGHTAYDTWSESKASTALKGFDRKHEEGASRDVLKYDIGSAVDVMIVAAKKRKDRNAIFTLMSYGVTEKEIESMWFDELRDKILDELKASGNPRTVGKKVSDGVASVKEAVLGPPDPPGGLPDPVTRWEKFKNAVKLKSLRKSMKDNWANAGLIRDSKNETSHNGRSDRGGGSRLFYALRGTANNEKSLQKTRLRIQAENEQKKKLDPNYVEKELPRSSHDKSARKQDQDARMDDSKPIVLTDREEYWSQAGLKKRRPRDVSGPELPVESFRLDLLQMSDDELILKGASLVNPNSEDQIERLKVIVLHAEIDRRKREAKAKQEKAKELQI